MGETTQDNEERVSADEDGQPVHGPPEPESNLEANALADSESRTEAEAQNSDAIIAYGGMEGKSGLLLLSSAEMIELAGPTPKIPSTQLLAGPGEINEPAGFGHYCSMTWPGGGWAYASDVNGNDPCTALRNQFGWAGAIRKAGLYSSAGANQVVVWCNGDMWGPALYRGNGNGPLTSGYNASVNSGQPSCIMTASPLNLPIFTRSPGTFTSTGTGVDFARDGGSFTLHTGWFGATGSALNPAATQVNMRGRSKANFADDHDGWDWLANKGTALYAMATGRVISSRLYSTGLQACPTAEAAKKKYQADAPCINRDFAPTSVQPDGDYIEYRNQTWDGGDQGEMYIRHRVVSVPPTYNESFVAGYFHLDRNTNLVVNAVVTTSTQLGTVGNNGGTSAPHLHLTVFRESNIAQPGQRGVTFSPNHASCGPCRLDPASCLTCPGCSFDECYGDSHNFHEYAIDPYGWQALQNVDPRGWYRAGGGAPTGAMSIKLWSSSVTPPPTGTWGN